MTVTTVTVKGQVTIPKPIRERLHLEAGSRVEFIVTEAGEVIVRPVSRRVDEVFGRLSEYGRRAPLSVEEMEAAVRERLRRG